MITLPDFEIPFEYENNFYLTCKTNRISKLIAHFELYKKAIKLSGEIVECGIFKGVSLVRWAHFREMFGGSHAKTIIGFDIFGKFPDTSFEKDKAKLESFTSKAGDESISKEQLISVLKQKDLHSNVELVEGDITKTVPQYVQEHPELRISFLNLDTDIYEPAVTILEYLYPKVVSGGVILLDDYGVFPGETKAVDDFFKEHDVKIKKFPYAMTPSYLVKK